jgi:peptide/nickel transport system permease protein
MLPTLLAVSALTFFLIRVTPSDPIASITGGRRINEDTRNALISQFGLDKSMPEQYLSWLGGLFKGDLGTSFAQRQPVSALLAQRFPTTVQLILMALLISLVLALPIGILCAVYKDRLLDRLLSGLSVLLVSAPNFLIALILMLLFSLRFPLFPSMGAGQNIIENFYYLFLPSCALALNMVALFARILRQSLCRELDSPHALTERAKGSRRIALVFRSCLRGSLIPLLTVGGIQIGSMIAGAVLVESVFALGGIGSMLISGIKAADYPVVQSLILILVAAFLIINLVVDLLYALIDPRIRQGQRQEGGADAA